MAFDSYSETNKDEAFALQDNHPSDIVAHSTAGQTFAATSTFHLTRAKFYISKTGSPTGTVYARLYAATGTPGTDGKPTGSVLASSTGVDVTTFSPTPTFTLIEFDFTGDLYEIQNGNNYCIVLEAPVSGTINETNCPMVGRDDSSPTHAGNSCYYNNGAWNNYASDVCFYIYGGVTKALAEAFSIVDSWAARFDLAEAFSTVDSLVNSGIEQLAEAFSVVDSWVARIAQSEAFSIVDSLVKNGTEQLAEVLSAVDSFVRSGVKQVAEAFSVVDTKVTNAKFAPAESLSVVMYNWRKLKCAALAWAKKDNPITTWIKKD